jgi:hypothetical protein
VVAAPILVIGFAVTSPKPASAQFDTGAIIAMLTTIDNILKNTVIPILNAMSSNSASMVGYQQSVVYPQAQIQQSQRQASINLNSMSSMQSIFSQPTNSASLTSTKSFEAGILSGNANNISSVSSSYANVYGAVPSSTALTSSARTVTDATDAQAQNAYKKAMQLDAIANTETTLSKQYMQQLQTMAPGNVPLLHAHISAWNLQAAAYTQQGLDELLRVMASENAYQSYTIKQKSAAHQQVLQKFGLSSSN